MSFLSIYLTKPASCLRKKNVIPCDGSSSLLSVCYSLWWPIAFAIPFNKPFPGGQCNFGSKIMLWKDTQTIEFEVGRQSILWLISCVRSENSTTQLTAGLFHINDVYGGMLPLPEVRIWENLVFSEINARLLSIGRWEHPDGTIPIAVNVEIERRMKNTLTKFC